jgi:vancomycin resistance protein VanJ
VNPVIGPVPPQPVLNPMTGPKIMPEPDPKPVDPANAPVIPAQPTGPDSAASARVRSTLESSAPPAAARPATSTPPASPAPAATPQIEAFPETADETGVAASDEPAAEAPDKLWRKRARSPMRRQTSTAIAVLGWLAVSFLVLHRYLPDTGGIGSLLETWLPWLAMPILVLLLAAGIVHTRRALIATLAATLVWTGLYGPQLLPRGSSAPAQLHIFSEDVNGVASEVTAAGKQAMAQHADVVALEDVYSGVAQSRAVNALNAAYKYHVTEYEFGLWSRYPISGVGPVSLGSVDDDSSVSLGSQSAGMAASSGAPLIGALKATLEMPDGQPLTVFLVHLPQPTLGNQGFAKERDAAFTEFVAMLKANTSPRLAVIGDVNVAATDRQFSQLTTGVGLRSAQQAVGSGFGFTWPAEFPIVRLDDVLTRGLQPLRSTVLPAIAGGQAHLPIEVDLNY